jgi:hypothetical protein
MVVRTKSGDGYTAEVLGKYNEYRRKRSALANKRVDEDNARALNGTLNRAAESTSGHNGLYESPVDEEM